MSLRLPSSFFALSLLVVGCSERSPSQPGVRFEHLALELAEPAAELTVKVRLTDAPAGVVTVPLASSDPTEGTVVPAELVFTAENWAVPQAVTVRAADDAEADGVQAWTLLTGALRSADDRWNGFDPTDLALTTWDDERGALRVTAMSGTLGEWGSTATFTVALASPPGADVTVALTSMDSTEGTVRPAQLVFTKDDWSTPQAVTVKGADDLALDGKVAWQLKVGPTQSDDPAWTGLEQNVEASTDDDDRPRFQVKGLAGRVTEGGEQATFLVVLDVEPSEEVSIAVTSSDPSQATVAPDALVFGPDDWRTPQRVTVSAVSDDRPDGDRPFTVVVGPAQSATPGWSSLPVVELPLLAVDDDAAGYVVSPLAGTVTEAGGEARFTVHLESPPLADVTVPVRANDATEAVVAPAQLVFTAANWQTPQAVTLTGVDDAIDDGDVFAAAVFGPVATGDAVYAGLSVPRPVGMGNRDDDTAALNVTPLTGSLTEAGGTATFTVRLASEPVAAVTVPVVSSDLTEATVSPTSLVFTAANWTTPQTVTVTGVDDAVRDGDQPVRVRLGPSTSTDAVYAGREPLGPQASVADDDEAGITVSAVTGQATEARGTATFTVRLLSQPTANVSLPVASSDVTEGTVAPASLTFSPTNWSTPQVVTLTGVDDALDDGDVDFVVRFSPAVTGDANYVGRAPEDVAVSTLDDDVAGLVVSTVAGRPTEAGASATFTVKLRTQPSAAVSFALSSSDPAQGSVSPASLTFTTSSWNTAQTVTASAIDDAVDDGDVAFSVSFAPGASTDPSYDGLQAADVALSTLDDDTQRLVVAAPTGSPTEAGAAVVFLLQLEAQPTSEVTFPLSSSDETEGTVSPASVTFSPSDWHMPQQVTVTGVDDAIDDDATSFSLVIGASTSQDPGAQGLDPADPVLRTTDDDTLGLRVSAASATSLPEAGGSATFTVVLDSQPTADVTLALSSSDVSEGAPSVASLTFTAANWSQAQTVTVNAVGDARDDGDQAFDVVIAAAVSTDGLYAGLNPADLSFTAVDDDTAGLSVSALSGTLAESGGSATFIVRLDSQPSADVTIALSSSDPSEGAPSVASLTFTAANWSQAQTVTVDAVSDAVDDGDVTFTIVLEPATSTDPLYAGRDLDDLSATTVDDDAVGVNVSALSGPVSEAGGTATFLVRLEAQPLDDVTIPVSVSDPGEGSADVTSLVFTPENWFTTQTVTLTGLDDAEDDGDVTFTVLLDAASSSDGAWAGVDATNVTATNTDDDAAAIDVSTTSGLTVTEAGGTAGFTVALGSQPTADVTITLASSDATEGTASPATLTFTATNWSTAQAVTVTGAEDFDVDADVAFSVTVTATSQDAKYQGRTGASVGVTNGNDDFSCDPVSATTVWSSGLYRYATIDCTAREAAGISGTVGWWKVPQGWALAPNDAATQAATADFTWATAVLVFADGIGWGTPGGGYPVAFWDANLLKSDSGGGYNAGALNARVFLRQLDPAALTVSPASGLVTTEAGGTATFTVRLASQPWEDVTVSVGSGDSTEGDAAPSTLTFTSSNWSTAQTITLTGAADAELDGDAAYVVGLSSTSLDPSYAGRTATVSASNTNDDFQCDPAASPDTFVVLGAYRYASVDCALPTNAVPGSMNGFYRPATDWELAPDDAEGQAAVDARPWGAEFMYLGAGVLRTTSLHATPGVSLGDSWPTTEGLGFKFPGLNARLLVRQQDPAGFVVTPTSGLATSERGATATFTVKLGRQPQGDVTVPLTSSDTTEGTVSPSSLTFTSVNWNAAQTVTVAGVDDADADGLVAYTITLDAASSSDPGYQGRVGASVAVTNATDECDPLASAGTNVESGSFRYASIDCVEVQSVAVGCTSGAWRVPAGWELAPAGAASEAAAMGFPWGTHVAVLADGSGWWTSLGTALVGPSGQYAGSHLTSDGQGGTGVDTCSLRVLVRQPTP